MSLSRISCLLLLCVVAVTHANYSPELRAVYKGGSAELFAKVVSREESWCTWGVPTN